MDAFRMFDLEGKGWIGMAELREGFLDIGVHSTMDESTLFFKRYDKDNDGRIRYSDFCDALTPHDLSYADMLNARTPYFIHTPHYRRDEYFHPATRYQVRDTMRASLNIESASD
jgi:hypothetical protein